MIQAKTRTGPIEIGVKKKLDSDLFQVVVRYGLRDPQRNRKPPIFLLGC